MNDLIVGVLTVAIGLAFAFRGYLAIRILLPIWGFLFGFGVGVGIVAAVTGDGVFSTVASWAAGLGVAIVFATIAYLYYEVAVVLTMAGSGFVLGTTVLVALSIEWNWVVTAGGLVVGALFAFIALALDLPMLLLTLVTATAGAATAVTGAMLLFGDVDTADFDDQSVVESFDASGIWWVAYAVLAIAGFIAQLRQLESMMRPMREEWEAGGGRGLYDPNRA